MLYSVVQIRRSHSFYEFFDLLYLRQKIGEPSFREDVYSYLDTRLILGIASRKRKSP